MRELELYVQAGIPARRGAAHGDARRRARRRAAASGSARSCPASSRTSSSWTATRARIPGALRNLRLVVKDGVPLEPDAMWRELGILPLPKP